MRDENTIGPWFKTPLTVGDGTCRGDRAEHVQDLFRLLRRAREYLVEADRQLRGGGTAEEQASSQDWYADMDANDEWRGNTAEAHADSVLDILFFFDEYAAVIAALNRQFPCPTRRHGCRSQSRRYDDRPFGQTSKRPSCPLRYRSPQRGRRMVFIRRMTAKSPEWWLNGSEGWRLPRRALSPRRHSPRSNEQLSRRGRR
jgi:hypothetical protein